MANANKIIVLHGGEIWTEPNLNLVSSFNFTIKKMEKIDCILLIDDDEATNFLHQIIIEEADICNQLVVKSSALEALEYLKQEGASVPNLIFLDINMPKMNGWQFLEAYADLNNTQKAKMVVVMLSTSINPKDHTKADEIPEVKQFINKPLSEEVLLKIKNNYLQ